MAKRKTKAERIEDEKAALQQRLADMLRGAEGGDLDPDDDCAAIYPGILSNWLSAIRWTLLTKEQRDERPGMMNPACLGYFENVPKATDWLYEYGVRA